MTTGEIAQMDDAEFARYLHEHRLRMLERYLRDALQWRDQWRRDSRPWIRTICRRNMRQSALSWRRHWGSL